MDEDKEVKILELQLKEQQQGFLDEDDMFELYNLLISDDEEDIGYSEKWDALYDLNTFEWLEEGCGCDTCLNRPPRFPFMKVVVNNDLPKWKRT